MDEEHIERLEERLRRAMATSNGIELEQLLADDLVFTNFLGEKMTKAQDLAAHASGYLTMHSISVCERQTIALGDTFVVTCLAQIDASVDGERTCSDFRFIRVWAPKRAGQYQVIAGQATIVQASLLQ